VNRLIAIDSTNLQFRAIFAYRNNPNVPVTYTYLRMLVGYFKKLNITLEDMVVLALDYGSWRKQVDKTYKAQRQEFRESFEEKAWWEARYKEFNDLYEKMKISMPLNIIKIYNCEADDIISVSCRQFPKKEIIIISSDRDLEQLCQFENVQIFSPITKKFKEVKNPMKVLLDKIQGDISDNLLDKPSSEAEFDKRKKIVDLVNPLPDNIELIIKEALSKITPKNLYAHKVPYRTIRLELEKLYKQKEQE
jgi:5'-3' exonuclease